MKRIILTLFLLTDNFSYAKTFYNNLTSQNYYMLNAKDFSLYKCLENNHNKIGIAHNDSSTLSNKYTPDEWLKINEFIKNKTDDYYKEVSIIHLEDRGDKTMNSIFSKCINFYHSKELELFLKKNKLNK